MVGGSDDHGSCVENLAVADLTCIGDEQKQQLRGLGYKFSNADQWLDYNVAVSYYDGSLVAYVPETQNKANLSKSQLEIVPPHYIYNIGAFVDQGVQGYAT